MVLPELQPLDSRISRTYALAHALVTVAERVNNETVVNPDKPMAVGDFYLADLGGVATVREMTGSGRKDEQLDIWLEKRSGFATAPWSSEELIETAGYMCNLAGLELANG